MDQIEAANRQLLQDNNAQLKAGNEAMREIVQLQRLP